MFKPPPALPRPRCPQERAHARELAALKADLEARTRELLAHSRDNTGALNAVSDLTRSQQALETAVLRHRAGLFDDQLAARRATLAERHTLVTTVNERAATLQALCARVDALRRKDTVLYAA